MKEFMLIYHGGDPEVMAQATSEERGVVMAAWGAWMASLGEKLVNGGSPLMGGGKRIKKDGLVTDIAASELKELVTGYSIIKAESYAEAIEMASACPIFRQKDADVEVRMIAAI